MCVILEIVVFINKINVNFFYSQKWMILILQMI